MVDPKQKADRDSRLDPYDLYSERKPPWDRLLFRLIPLIGFVTVAFLLATPHCPGRRKS